MDTKLIELVILTVRVKSRSAILGRVCIMYIRVLCTSAHNISVSRICMSYLDRMACQAASLPSGRPSWSLFPCLPWYYPTAPPRGRLCQAWCVRGRSPEREVARGRCFPCVNITNEYSNFTDEIYKWILFSECNKVYLQVTKSVQTHIFLNIFFKSWHWIYIEICVCADITCPRVASRTCPATGAAPPLPSPRCCSTYAHTNDIPIDICYACILS